MAAAATGTRLRARSLDWPLSREEKKSRVVHLYERDVKAADSLLQVYEREREAASQAGGAVRQQQEAPAKHKETPRACQQPSARRDATTSDEEDASLALSAEPSATAAADAVPAADGPCTVAPLAQEVLGDPEEALKYLRVAVANAAAALGVSMSDLVEYEEEADEVIEERARMRTRSEGNSNREKRAPSVLRQYGTPRRRHSRGGEVLRVSFGGCEKQPNEDFESDPPGSGPEPEPQPLPSQEPCRDSRIPRRLEKFLDMAAPRPGDAVASRSSVKCTRRTEEPQSEPPIVSWACVTPRARHSTGPRPVPGFDGPRPEPAVPQRQARRSRLRNRLLDHGYTVFLNPGAEPE